MTPAEGERRGLRLTLELFSALLCAVSMFALRAMRETLVFAAIPVGVHRVGYWLATGHAG